MTFCPYWRLERFGAGAKLGCMATKNKLMLPPTADFVQVESHFRFAQMTLE